MANPFVKSYKYFMSWFGAKVDEKADPKVQIQQAIEEAQRQHNALSQQAAQVIGNQRQLEMQLSKRLTEVEKLQDNTRQALVLADRSNSAGDTAKAHEYEESAQRFANELVTAEKSMDELKSMHDQSVGAAEQAKRAVEQNAVQLKAQVAQRTRLLTQLDQAKMQERVSASLEQMSNVATGGNVPNFAEVEEKIQRRYATALGRAELAGTSVEGRMLEVERSSMDFAGAARLDEIRASISGELTSSAGSDAPAVESRAGDSTAPPEDAVPDAQPAGAQPQTQQADPS
ncbi:MAG: PspA/IM30 family protein [Mycobacteriales bacterium]